MVIRSKSLIAPLSAAALVLGLLLHVGPASAAATFTVNSTADAPDSSPGNGICATAAGTCTLRAAVMEANALAAANPGSPNTINVPAGNYLLTGARGEDGATTGDLDVNRGQLTIVGAGANTVFDGNGVDRVFHLGPLGAARLTIMGATIQNGNASTGSLQPGGPDIGGGIRLEKDSKLVVDSVTFQNNRANARGGAIGMPPTAGTVVGGTGTMDLTNVTMRNNSSGVEGGAFFNNLSTRVTNAVISDNVVNGTAGNERGGAIAQSGDLTLSVVVLQNNVLTPSVGCGQQLCPAGGAIANRGDPNAGIFGTIRLDNVFVSGNRAPSGAGIANGFDAIAIITNTSVSANHATGRVGGIANLGRADLTDVVISYNSAPFVGGLGTFGPPAGSPNAVTRIRNTALQYNSPSNCGLPGPSFLRAPVSLGNNVSTDFSCNLNGPNDRNGTG